MLFTNEIYKFLYKNIRDPRASIIVTSIDKLPQKFSKPLFLIINEGVSTSDGSHWFAIFINKSHHGIFIDSFGRKPNSEVEKFLRKFTKTYESSNVWLQMTTSTWCGLFSAVALVEFSRGKTLQQFLRNFDPFNRLLNDLMIKNMAQNNCTNKLSM